MRNGDFTDFLRELKEKNDITEVIGSYIKLERRGYQYWACCPFHHEKTPSFAVNAAERYYHCFGCGASGDVITFVKNYENCDFMQAVHILADRVKMEVPAFDDRSAEEAAEKKKKRDRLHALMKDAARFYLNNLYSGRADEYLSYLEKRKISTSTAKKFGLGASLDFQSLPSHLLAQGYTREECVESGACGRTEEGRIFDSLGGRLIFPVINQFDDVIAFGGRVMKPTDHAKYKNTRETEIFNKSRNLYNINLLKKEKRAGGLPYIVMLEGYFDVVSLYQAGFRNVVASMGTSLTKEQVRLCKRYADTVLISYDGDAAGQSANLRGLKLLEDEGVKIRVVPLPDGLDPDDVITKQGTDAYRDCLGRAMPLIDYRLLSARRRFDLTRSEEKREFVKEALAVVREAESETEKEELLKRIAAEADISYSALESDLDRVPLRKDPEKTEPPKRETERDRERLAMRFVLAACLFSKPYTLGYDLCGEDFPDPVLRTIADYITAARKEGKVRPSGIFDLVDDGEKELSEVLNLDSGDTLEGEGAERYFRDCTGLLERRRISALYAAVQEKLAGEVTPEERRELLAQLSEYSKKLKKVRNGGKI